MKQLFENFRKYVNEGQQEDLNTQIALKIANGGIQDVALGMSDDDLKDLVVYVYDKEFDETGEGWDPYDEDLAQIRDVLTPDDEEDRDEYGIEEMIREEVKKHPMWNPKTGKKTMADGEKHKELAKKGHVHYNPKKVKSVIDKEGGAAGLDAIAKQADADKKELKKSISKVKGVVKHKKGDFITVSTGRQVAEEMIREELRMMIEKRKKRKKRKKSKSKKKKSNKICPAGIAWAKRTFDTYPSAYANLAASKYCKDPNYAKGSKRKKK